MYTNQNTFWKTHGTKSSLWLYFYEWAVNILKLYQIGSFPYSSKNKFELCNSFGIWISAQYWPLVLNFFLPCRARNFLWETEFSCDTYISLQGLPLSFHPISLSLSLFLQYSSWNTDRHIFVCCLTILHIPHTSWYSVLLSQSIRSTVTSYHLSKLTIFISVFRIFRQPVFSFFVCQFLNDQYQQHCTNNFLVIFLIDRWTERQTNKQLP